MYQEQRNRQKPLHKYRGVVQLVERRSPKPNVEGSNPSAPASQDKDAEKRLFSLYINPLRK